MTGAPAKRARLRRAAEPRAQFAGVGASCNEQPSTDVHKLAGTPVQVLYVGVPVQVETPLDQVQAMSPSQVVDVVNELHGVVTPEQIPEPAS